MFLKERLKGENMKNILFKDFGVFLNTDKMEQYEVNKVIIFKDGEEKIIANYFLDNFKDYQAEINGEIKRKIKKELTANYNFVVKSEEQNSWNDKTQYTLYINGELNNYNFIGLELSGEQLNVKYSINDVLCSQCIGWNQKASNKAKYKDFEEAYKKINLYTIDNAEMEEFIKDLLKAYKQYKKAKETEKTYTCEDYKKMSLSSGTSKSENITMLKNNGFDVEGLSDEKEE